MSISRRPYVWLGRFFPSILIIPLLPLLTLVSLLDNVSSFDVTPTRSSITARKVPIVRLNKIISMEKKISRRKSDEFIKDGNVKLNNKVVKNPGTHIDVSKDKIKISGKLVNIVRTQKMINRNDNNFYKWFVLHKPKGFLCTSNDEKDRASIYSLFPQDIMDNYRLVSVGRLDRNTSGVLLLTNEYAWVNKLTHPKYQRIRTYRVHIEGPAQMKVLKQLATGIYLQDDNRGKENKKIVKKKRTQPAFIEILREETIKVKDQVKKVSVLNISVREGRNRQIRKMFEQINQPVIKIKRTAFENITLKDVFFPKQYRELTQREISNLKARRL
ncbi:pseudouridine synthase, putative [Plasmodium knowlesi strain H]|uniref:Pseudouridine synthase, putative n=3 Tax=Plasmodium knowlesi TaxID=5850 RepID=A0A5K1VPT0_PLAKH|nr:pseudouridine synthase, putative [Plasmodium knowlesi strain H]OTN66886.1 putative Pseudouridine synthase [Plasmodium knowlesi]CAA9986657.1 pseudouridine synthase, putative [Plasmodium knowlesi strain H]SBO23461.1 pseudouridine synthase, putative [Plasmodium knowlesi strain H]SBO24899.1 pseudouridine synthase, putative [Plasmodium knowlesi strain H]VVS76131.1 pseudouridine synthase, putative [Plasmodium knowlesi strain H]|eukprot:XP_002257843.1 pseudouridine synthetase, putative [Plasmodium knowlesi strain H]